MKAYFFPPLLPTPKNHYSLFSPNPKILRTLARIPHSSGIFLELSQNTTKPNSLLSAISTMKGDRMPFLAWWGCNTSALYLAAAAEEEKKRDNKAVNQPRAKESSFYPLEVFAEERTRSPCCTLVHRQGTSRPGPLCLSFLGALWLTRFGACTI